LARDRWRPEFFAWTKRAHNGLYGSPGDGERSNSISDGHLPDLRGTLANCGWHHFASEFDQMRKDVREFIRRVEAAGLTVEPTPGHYRVLRDGKPLRKENGMPLMLPFSPDTARWRRAAIVDLRKLGIDV
jgi:hypothetical protein